jgi:hypothetical protein
MPCQTIPLSMLRWRCSARQSSTQASFKSLDDNRLVNTFKNVVQHFPPPVTLDASSRRSLPYALELPIQTHRLPFRKPRSSTVISDLGAIEVCLEDLRCPTPG